MRVWIRAILISLLGTFSAAIVKADDTAGIQKDSIKIGIIGPLSGKEAVYKKGVFGASAVYQDVNDKGGIYGRKIELVIEDDGCEINKSIAAYKKLVAHDQVFLIHGGFCSLPTLALRPEIAKNAEVPFIVLAAVAAGISNPVLPNLFQPVPTSKTVGETLTEFALSKPNASKIAIVKHSDDWASSIANPAIARLKEHGLEPVIVTALERGATDATSQVFEIKKADPDVVLAVLYPVELAIYLRNAYKYRFNTTTLGTTAASIDDIDKQLGIRAAIKDFFVPYNLSAYISDPSLSPYTGLLKKYYPSESLDTFGLYPMGGALAIVEVLKRLGPNPTRSAFIAEMNKLTNFDPGVQYGKLSFTSQDHDGHKTIGLVGIVRNKTRLFDRYPVLQ